MKKKDLKLVVWKEGDYHISQCIDVDVSSFGKTKKEAIDNLREALELYFEDNSAPEMGEIINPQIESVKI